MAAAGLAIVGQIGAIAINAGAASKLRRANKLLRRNKFQSIVQKRRAFLRNARAAIASNLVAGVATGASLDSSAFQGIAASLQTQEAVALTEFNFAARNELEAQDLTDRAGELQSQASMVQGAASAASSIAGLKG